MKLLFAHDHCFSVSGSHVYSSALPYAVWQRYLETFEEITVLARRSGAAADPSKDRISSGAGVRFSWASSISSASSFFGLRLRVKEQVRRLLEEHDALVARLPSELGLVAIEVARSVGKPYLIELVACAWDALRHHGSLRARAYAPMAARRVRRAVGQAGFVTYVSRQFLQARYPAPDGAIAVAVSDVELPSHDDAVLRRRIERIRTGGVTTVLGLIGSLKTRYKGVHTAIEALGRLNGHQANFRLRVLGRGDASAYQRLARSVGVEEKTRFEGTLLGGPAVLSWLDGVDVYLQPSFQEGVPRALIEAMSRGCPCLGSSAGGIPELLEDDCIFSPGDVSAMAKLLEKHAGDARWREAQAWRNYEESKNYSRTALEGRRRELLRALAAAAREAKECAESA